MLTVITAVDAERRGGAADPEDFDIHIRRGVVEVAGGAGSGGAGTAYTLDAGTYAVSADGMPGYAPVGSGACAENGTVALALGEEKTCTITNVAGAPTLKVISAVINDDGGTATPGSFSAARARWRDGRRGQPAVRRARPGRRTRSRSVATRSRSNGPARLQDDVLRRLRALAARSHSALGRVEDVHGHERTMSRRR